MAGKSDAVPKDPFCILPVLSSEMSLLPPSYFMAAKAVSKTEGAEEDEYQMNLQELQALREENKKLRYHDLAASLSFEVSISFLVYYVLLWNCVNSCSFTADTQSSATRVSERAPRGSVCWFMQYCASS